MIHLAAMADSDWNWVGVMPKTKTRASKRARRQNTAISHSAGRSSSDATWRRLLLGSASAAVFTALSAGTASAQSWTGAISNDWMDGSNWSGGSVPAGVLPVTLNLARPPAIIGVNGAVTAQTNIMALSTNLTIQNGSTLTSNGQAGIASNPGSTSIATVTGAGSVWNANARMNIGGAAFDNGVLRASQANANFITNLSAVELNIGAGGLTVDTIRLVSAPPARSATPPTSPAAPSRRAIRSAR